MDCASVPDSNSIFSVIEPFSLKESSPPRLRQISRHAQTVTELFEKNVRRFGDRTAFRYIQPRGVHCDQHQGEIREAPVQFNRRFSVISFTWKRYAEEARKFAKALIAHGVQPHEVVTIQGANSPQWLFANLGTILAGGVSAGVYPTNGRELCKHIVESSGARVAVVEDEDQLQKYVGVESTALKCIVVWNKIAKPVDGLGVPVVRMDEFLRSGQDVPDAELQRREREQDPRQPCALVYTSGTTGNPKGATLTHDNLTWTSLTSARRFALASDDRGIGFLPLSHVAPLQLDCIAPMGSGHSIDIAPGDVLKGTNLRTHMVQTRPTYFFAIPRVWEKFKEAIEARVATAPFLKKKLFEITTSISRTLSPDHSRLATKNGLAGLSFLERIRYVFEKCILFLLEKIILGPIKEAIGLNRCRLAASGAGAMDQEVRTFFEGLNLHILDFYGLSETSGPVCLPDGNTPVGSCGRPIPGTKIKILDPNERGEGEILVQGPNIFAEYWRDQEATDKAFDGEGFFHTGDQGRLDATGNLFITGRIKEIIKTSGGENIPPLKIEERIKAQLPIVSQSILIGDKRNYLTCLLTLRTEVDGEGTPTERLAPEVIEVLRGLGSQAVTLREAGADPRVQAYLMQGIERANREADSRAQHVQKCIVLPEEISVANGLLTPTLKMKRSLIEQKYQEEIRAMYSVSLAT